MKERGSVTDLADSVTRAHKSDTQRFVGGRRIAAIGVALGLAMAMLGISPAESAPTPSVAVKCVVGGSTTLSWHHIRGVTEVAVNSWNGASFLGTTFSNSIKGSRFSFPTASSATHVDAYVYTSAGLTGQASAPCT